MFYSPREFTPISQLAGLSVDQLAYREVDTVGIVVCTVSDHVMSHDPEGPEWEVDSVFVADPEGCLMVVRIWDGLKVNINTLTQTHAQVSSSPMFHDIIMDNAYISTCTHYLWLEKLPRPHSQLY